jgi:hypothetical protein
VGARVCVSGVCDPKDNTCGLANGDGPCTSNGECRDDVCNAPDGGTGTCGPPAGCTSDAGCPAGDYCGSGGTCTPKMPTGSSCSANDQCQTNDCELGVCSSTVVASGNGLVCTARPGDARGEDTGAGVALLLAALGLARRRRSPRG